MCAAPVGSVPISVGVEILHKLPSTKGFLIPSVHTHKNKEVQVHNHYSKNYLGSSLTVAFPRQIEFKFVSAQFKFMEHQGTSGKKLSPQQGEPAHHG